MFFQINTAHIIDNAQSVKNNSKSDTSKIQQSIIKYSQENV